MERKYIRIPEKDFNRIFIVEDRAHWEACADVFNKATDLVLAMDLGLVKLLEQAQATVYYLDHILDRDYLETVNYELHHFLNRWYQDKDGNDVFTYQGVAAGNAFLLNILNDISYNVHFFINLYSLRNIPYQEIICAGTDPILRKWLDILYPRVKWLDKPNNNSTTTTYYFPISKWMESKIENDSLGKKIRRAGLRMFDYIGMFRDFITKKGRPAVYMQHYYPTAPIIDELKKQDDVRIIMANYSSPRNVLSERRIFYRGKRVPAAAIAANLRLFEDMPKYKWEIDGFDIAARLYEMILPRLPKLLQIAYSRIADITAFFSNKQLKLMVPVTDLWIENRLIMNYCKRNNIPVYMIINGILANNFAYDARDSDWVNSYGDLIREDYFGGAQNAVCLGDPRMDNYIGLPKKEINREDPVIVIGAGGYNPVDMNSYLAYEFDFLYDLLEILDELRKEGYKNNIILKVRANGYVSQYTQFLQEYFPGMNITVEQQAPFTKVVQLADLYISFYSQTLFEASILGIPALYYKKDQHIINRPFDGNSELVMARSREELKDKIKAFYNIDPVYNNFLNKTVLEKYIGPLDGKNTQRNVDFINSFLN
ncbi:hypothetical protein CLV51_101273 [Chitinophaga niastensis]|uniref:CDP-glycerol:poly(Glycerophosphate) glycerophosphotransferase n=1 Tax=Chitinophaga niastensis TaxID=536980 RepID=A0A2P8HRU5_CHINA|nr:hypothetical protein [Chitinophaga niastensis]PSL48943.1 hypothetical protein CLV51_101273 [Chitinophaga niastensis]